MMESGVLEAQAELVSAQLGVIEMFRKHEEH